PPWWSCHNQDQDIGLQQPAVQLVVLFYFADVRAPLSSHLHLISPTQFRDAASTIVTWDRKRFLFTEGSVWPSCYTGWGLVLLSVPGSRCYHGLLHWGLPLVVFLPSAAH